MNRPCWDESKIILIFGVGPEDLIFLDAEKRIQNVKIDNFKNNKIV